MNKPMYKGSYKPHFLITFITCTIFWGLVLKIAIHLGLLGNIFFGLFIFAFGVQIYQNIRYPIGRVFLFFKLAVPEQVAVPLARQPKFVEGYTERKKTKQYDTGFVRFLNSPNKFATVCVHILVWPLAAAIIVPWIMVLFEMIK